MKRVISLLLILILFLFCLPTAGAVSVSDFSDVGATDWFYPAVSFVIEKGMFNGTSASTFSPNDTMTRAMFVTVLGRYGNAQPVVPGGNQGIVIRTDVNMRNAPTTSGSQVLAVLGINTQVEIIGLVDGSTDPSYKWYYVNYNGTKGYIRSDLMEPLTANFTDVPADEYYTGYVYWAYNSGIAEKSGADTFSPSAPITREEICSMLYNFAGTRNLALNATVATINFKDSSSISSAYSTAVSVTQRAGIVNGYDDGTFRPKESATRAEVSAMLSRFIDSISYKPIQESSLDANGNYIWGTEAPKNNYVNQSYFSDACFIGHSFVVGMKNYFGFTDTDFFAFNGATARSIQTFSGFAGTGVNSGKQNQTLENVLTDGNYGKVYLMLGTNEAGVGTTHERAFYDEMSKIIDLIRQTQPNAKLYLFAIPPVTQTCSESRADLCRDNIIRYNTIIKQLCRDKKAYYLNVFDLLVNSDGFLPENAAMSDGIHLLASEYLKMKDYIMTHTIG